MAFRRYRSRALTALKFFEAPPIDYRIAPLTSYGTPPDFKGRRVTALDYIGQPLYCTPYGTTVNDSMTSDANAYWKAEVFDTVNATPFDIPYEFDPSGNRVPLPGRTVPSINGINLNNPYTVGELERSVAAYNDVDFRSLPPRLAALLTSDKGGVSSWATGDAWRTQSLTTDRWDSPGPNLQVPRSMRSLAYFSTPPANGYRAFSIADLLRAKLMTTGLNSAAIDTEISRLLPPELVAGVRMDINQPFGNGRDNNGNGIVDDQAESASESFPPTAAVDSALNSVWTSSKPSVTALSVYPCRSTRPNGSSAVRPQQAQPPPGGYPATDPLLLNANGWSATSSGRA